MDGKVHVGVACGWLPARVATGALAFLGFVVLSSVRINLSVAIVAMVHYNGSNTATYETECWQPPRDNVSSEASSEGVLSTVQLPGEEDVSTEDRMEWDEVTQEDVSTEDRMEWDEVTQGLILGSFFYSYAFTQVLGGRLAEVYGTKVTFGLCGVASGVLTLFTPLAARSGPAAIMAVRALIGLCQGPMWPSMHSLLPRWVPPNERPRFVSIVYFGASLGMTVTLALCGVIIDALGWSAAFYIPGSLCLLWACAWFLLVADTPDQHPRISQQEREYINEAVRAAGMSQVRAKRVPWRAMATSVPLWALIACDMGNGFGNTIFFSQLPTFLQNILGFSIKENGVVSSLPFLCRFVGAVSFSWLSDGLVTRGYLSCHSARRIFSSIAMFSPAVLIIAAAYAGCSAVTIVTLFCLSNLFNGAISSCITVNHADIAPNFSGTLLGITNTFDALAMFASPVCVGAILQGQQTMGQWRKVFWMTVPFYVVTEIVFLVFCSVTVQPWNYAGQEEYDSGGSDDDDKGGNDKSERDANSMPVSRKTPLLSDLEKREAIVASGDT